MDANDDFDIGEMSADGGLVGDVLGKVSPGLVLLSSNSWNKELNETGWSVTFTTSIFIATVEVVFHNS